MRFVSTRGHSPAVSFAEAVDRGLAPDGGLYLLAELPDFADRLPAWEHLSYPALAAEFFGLFADGPAAPQLAALTAAAYADFDVPEAAALVPLGPGEHLLELFHGPTLAFKDFALRLLGGLTAAHVAVRPRRLTVLGATSGDTGSAAIHGLMDVPGARLVILYPQGRISPLQERQMACTGRANVQAVAIDGTFDDAQRMVKALFGEEEFRARHHLTAVNSINLARILGQCVYYVWAWLRLPPAERGQVTFVVPTGNFGNVLAGYLAHRMGLPNCRFRVATNQNDILWKLFETGVYEQGPVRPSLAPSMDIQVASNFERFLYYVEGGDAARVRSVMETFARTGRFTFPDWDRGVFSASRADDADLPRLIAEVHGRTGQVVDPHTACAFAGPRPEGTAVYLATAHPAKFPEVIERALGLHPTHPRLEALKARLLQRVAMPASLDALRALINAGAAEEAEGSSTD